MGFDYNLLEEANIIFEKEPMLIKLKTISNSIIVGDTHGDLDSSTYLINKYIDDDSINYVIFLGDYVDRGPKQIENINFLVEKKLQYPNKLVLLRGNHEWLEVNQNFGFYDEVITKMNKDTYEKYLEMFSKMSISFTSNNPINVIGVHAGIPVNPNEKYVYTLKDINQIEKNQKIFVPDNLITQLVWNDPKENVKYAKSSWRGAGYFFGIEAFDEFMEHNNLELCFRSHEAFHNVRTFFKDRLYSIFTCLPHYGITPNFLNINSEGKIIINTIT